MLVFLAFMRYSAMVGVTGLEPELLQALMPYISSVTTI